MNVSYDRTYIHNNAVKKLERLCKISHIIFVSHPRVLSGVGNISRREQSRESLNLIIIFDIFNTLLLLADA